MMNVDTIDRAEAKRLIFELKGGSLDRYDTLALDACTNHASHVWLCTVDGKSVAAWGLVPPTILADRAYLWLFTTPEVDNYKFLFVRRSQLVMEEMRKLYPLIYGVCELSNDRAIRWVKWLGAKFGEHNDTHIQFFIETPNG